MTKLCIVFITIFCLCFIILQNNILNVNASVSRLTLTNVPGGIQCSSTGSVSSVKQSLFQVVYQTTFYPAFKNVADYATQIPRVIGGDDDLIEFTTLNVIPKVLEPDTATDVGIDFAWTGCKQLREGEFIGFNLHRYRLSINGHLTAQIALGGVLYNIQHLYTKLQNNGDLFIFIQLPITCNTIEIHQGNVLLTGLQTPKLSDIPTKWHNNIYNAFGAYGWCGNFNIYYFAKFDSLKHQCSFWPKHQIVILSRPFATELAQCKIPCYQLPPPPSCIVGDYNIGFCCDKPNTFLPQYCCKHNDIYQQNKAKCCNFGGGGNNNNMQQYYEQEKCCEEDLDTPYFYPNTCCKSCGCKSINNKCCTPGTPVNANNLGACCLSQWVTEPSAECCKFIDFTGNKGFLDAAQSNVRDTCCLKHFDTLTTIQKLSCCENNINNCFTQHSTKSATECCAPELLQVFQHDESVASCCDKMNADDFETNLELCCRSQNLFDRYGKKKCTRLPKCEKKLNEKTNTLQPTGDYLDNLDYCCGISFDSDVCCSANIFDNVLTLEQQAICCDLDHDEKSWAFGSLREQCCNNYEKNPDLCNINERLCAPKCSAINYDSKECCSSSDTFVPGICCLNIDNALANPEQCCQTQSGGFYNNDACCTLIDDIEGYYSPIRCGARCPATPPPDVIQDTKYRVFDHAECCNDPQSTNWDNTKCCHIDNWSSLSLTNQQYCCNQDDSFTTLGSDRCCQTNSDATFAGTIYTPHKCCGNAETIAQDKCCVPGVKYVVQSSAFNNNNNNLSIKQNDGDDDNKDQSSNNFITIAQKDELFYVRDLCCDRSVLSQGFTVRHCCNIGTIYTNIPTQYDDIATCCSAIITAYPQDTELGQTLWNNAYKPICCQTQPVVPYLDIQTQDKCSSCEPESQWYNINQCCNTTDINNFNSEKCCQTQQDAINNPLCCAIIPATNELELTTTFPPLPLTIHHTCCRQRQHSEFTNYLSYCCAKHRDVFNDDTTIDLLHQCLDDAPCIEVEEPQEEQQPPIEEEEEEEQKPIDVVEQPKEEEQKPIDNNVVEQPTTTTTKNRRNGISLNLNLSLLRLIGISVNLDLLGEGGLLSVGVDAQIGKAQSQGLIDVKADIGIGNEIVQQQKPTHSKWDGDDNNNNNNNVVDNNNNVVDNNNNIKSTRPIIDNGRNDVINAQIQLDAVGGVADTTVDVVVGGDKGLVETNVDLNVGDNVVDAQVNATIGGADGKLVDAQIKLDAVDKLVETTIDATIGGDKSLVDTNVDLNVGDNVVDAQVNATIGGADGKLVDAQIKLDAVDKLVDAQVNATIGGDKGLLDSDIDLNVAKDLVDAQAGIQVGGDKGLADVQVDAGLLAGLLDTDIGINIGGSNLKKEEQEEKKPKGILSGLLGSLGIKLNILNHNEQRNNINNNNNNNNGIDL